MIPAVVLLAACASGGTGRDASTTTTTRPPSIVVTPFEQLAFLEVAGHRRGADDAGGSRAAALEKWTRDVTVTVDGPATPEDVAQVQRTVAALDLLMAPRHITLGPPGASGDVVVRFVPHSEFASVLGSANFPEQADGVTRPVVGTGSDAGVLRSARVVVDSTIPQYGRNRVIAHELLHAVGLGHSTCLSSVAFGESSTEASPRWSLSPFDQRMVQLLYRPELAPGTNVDDAAEILTPTAPAGVECEPVQWQVVVDADTGRHLFCAVSEERYRPCTGNVDTEPAGPIADPDLWFDGAYLYARRPG